MGRVVNGYESPKVVLTKKLSVHLKKRKQNLSSWDMALRSLAHIDHNAP